MTEDEKQKVLIRIVDDDQAVREGGEFMLSCKGWKVKSYASARDFLVSDTPSVPGCLVLDIRMPGMSGLELQDEMRKRGSTLPIIFLTGHGDIHAAIRTFKQGAADFLLKPVDNATLFRAIERSAADSLARSDGGLTGSEALDALKEMSDRETEILGLIREGMQNRAIAERLALSERTVQGHRNNIYHKLRVHTEAELLTCLARAEERKAADQEI